MKVYYSWIDFFDELDSISNFNDDQERIELSSSTTPNVYISYASFINTSSFGNSYGGAICFFTNQNSHLLVEHSLFHKCTSVYHYGGAIYAYQGGSIVINKCCSSYCHVDDVVSDGQFAYLFVSTADEIFNYMLDSSIINSHSLIESSSDTIEFSGSNITVKLLNMSNNECDFYPTFSMSLGTSSGCGICDYSLLYNNTANNCVISSFHGRVCYIENSNIIIFRMLQKTVE